MRKPSVWAYVGCSVLSCVFFMLGFTTSTANAAPVTLNFAGTVTLIEGPLNGGPVALGDSFSGSFAYESTTPGVIEIGLARFDAVTDVSVIVGGYSASRSGPPSRTLNAFGYGSAVPHFFNGVIRDNDGLTGANINGLTVDFFSMVLQDSS